MARTAPLAAMLAALIVAAAIAGGAAAQNCTRVPGCTACTEVPEDSGVRGRRLLTRGLLRRGDDDGPGHVNETEHPPGHDDGPCANKTKVMCTACDAARGFVLDAKFPLCVCPPGQELPRPAAGQPIAPGAACQPCANGFVSGPGAMLERNQTRPGRPGRVVRSAFGRARSALHSGENGRGKFRGHLFCVACPTGFTSNGNRTACVSLP